MPLLKTLLIALLLIQARLLAGQAGVYQSCDDFLSGRLFTADKNTRLHLHLLNCKASLEITHNDSSYRFSKSAIYGYKDKQGQAYRFFGGEVYPLLNPGEKILLYKVSSGSGLKNSPLTDTYFFSKDAGAPILPLQLPIVLAAFADQPALASLVELYCRSNGDLAAYDTIHRQYKLNRLLALSTNLKLN